MNSLAALLLLSAPSLVGTAPPQEPDDRFAALRTMLRAEAEELRFAGVVAVARGGELVFEEAFGPANVELDVPHTTRSRFKLHSLSKPFVGAALLRAVDDEALELDAPVGAYLPAWPLAWSDVTVRHLANHTSGLPDFAGSFLSGWSGSASATWEQLAPTLDAQTPAPAPGTGWAYSNAGYVLLAAVLENVREQPFATVLARDLCAPAGLEATELECTPPWDAIAYDGPRVLESLVSGYNGSPADLQVAHSKMYAIPGAGGIVSDARDLTRFAHRLFAGDLLSDEARAELFAVPPGQSVRYGIGWVLRERDGQPLCVHDGGNNGFVTSLEHDLGRDLSIAILSNLGYVSMGELRDRVAELVLAALD